MSAMSPLPKNDPRLVAWEAYKATEEYANTRKWALHEQHVDGSLWAAFLAGTALAKSAGQGDVVERLRKAVDLAARTFRRYEELHRQKGTSEGDAKALNNGELADAMEAALAAVPAGAEMREAWQPIETAPKDGRYVIAARFGPDQELRWVMHSRWVTAEECAECYGGSPREYEAGWTAGDDEDDDVYPTHWQPLPAPPALATPASTEQEA